MAWWMTYGDQDALGMVGDWGPGAWDGNQRGAAKLGRLPAGKLDAQLSPELGLLLARRYIPGVPR